MPLATLFVPSLNCAAQNDRRERYVALPKLVAVFACLTLGGCAGLGGPTAPPAPPSSVVAIIPVGDPPVLLAVSPNSQRVYAAGDATLSVISTTTNAVLATLTVNPQSAGIAMAPDGSRVYVDSLFSIDLKVLDTATNALLPDVTMFLQRLRGGFGRLVVAPDGQTIYVANKANQAFGVLDLSGGGSKILNPTVWPVDMAITPDGTTVVSVGCKQICTPGFIQLYDTASQRFTQEIAVGGNPYRVVLSPDGSQAYVANLTGPSVSIVDLAARQVIKTVRVPVQPTGLAIAPGGATLYVASQTEGRLSVVDIASGMVTAQLSVPMARDVVATPDGQRVYVSSENRVLAVAVSSLGTAP
ncbi:MAG: hypothetical protein ABI629_10275 [bacterium]